MVSIDTRAIGIAVVALGGGRVRAADPVDPRVGFTELARVGDVIDDDNPLGFVHAATESAADRAEADLRNAYQFGAAKDVLDSPSLIERIDLSP